MKIAKITLTDTHLIVTLGGESAENRYDVRAVYIDKANNYCNVYSSQPSKHTWSPEYTAVSNLIKITIPTYAPTFFTFTIIMQNEILIGMYVNEFSLFKAKSKYLLAFDECCGGCSSNNVCSSCNEKRVRYQTIVYMLRLNLFYQSYINGNVQLATKYYEDARRIYNMDDIFFEYVSFKNVGNITSPNLYNQFNVLNDWIKNNSQQCEKKVLESLLISDLYSLLFNGEFNVDDSDDPNDQTNGYMYYGYLNASDVSEYREMFTNTHTFGLLKQDEILSGISDGKIKKDNLSTKQFNMDVPGGATCLFVLIPIQSSKKAQKFNGIGSFVPFQATSDDYGFESNGTDTISVDGIEYKIYGENSNLEGERTIKIS